jgi:hypothetical protein
MEAEFLSSLVMIEPQDKLNKQQAYSKVKKQQLETNKQQLETNRT